MTEWIWHMDQLLIPGRELTSARSISFPDLYDFILGFFPHSLTYFSCLLNVCHLRYFTFVFFTRLVSSSCSLARQSPLMQHAWASILALMRHVCACMHGTLEISWHPWPIKCPAPSYTSTVCFAYQDIGNEMVELVESWMEKTSTCILERWSKYENADAVLEWIYWFLRIDDNACCLATILKRLLREH